MNKFLGQSISILLALLISAGALAGCGNDDEGGKTASTAKASAGQIEQAGQLAMIRAHQIASESLYEKGQVAKSAKHAGHPVEEVFFALSRTLRSKDAALTADLRTALKRPNDVIYAREPAAKLKTAYKDAGREVERAEATLVPEAMRDTTAFRAQVIANLLETVHHEYSEAVVNGTLKMELEYQDAWGALKVADARFAAARAEFGDQASEIERNLHELNHLLPGVEPPARLATPEAVGVAVDGAVAALNEVAQAR